jgi:multimeric flavodoxin WrbA
MKRITAVIGTPRGKNSNTAKLARYFLEGLKAIYSGIDYEIITLGSSRISMCNGCMACNKRGMCVIDDCLSEIQEKLLKSDLVILGSPVYCWQVSAQFKAFMDRLFIWIHTQRLIGKPAITVSTTALDGLKPTVKYLKSSLYMLGLIPVGKLEWSMRKTKTAFEPEKVQNLYRKLSHSVLDLLNGKKELRPTLMNNLYFKGITGKILKSERLVWERDFLKAKGWENLNYEQAMRLELSRVQV